MSGGALERIVLIVDAANVMGARPDGWWRDRAGAAERIIAEVARLVERGFPASALRRTGIEHATRTQESGQHETGQHQSEQHAEPPSEVIALEAIIVLEGAAKPAMQRAAPEGGPLAGGRLRLVAAAGSGDDEIVEQARSTLDADPARSVLIATSDRRLRARLVSLGARCMGSGAFRALLPGP